MSAKILFTDSVQKLQLANVPNPQLDVQILLELATGKERSYFFAHPEYELAEVEQTKFNELLARRLAREPISHIIGKKEFYGREFTVNEHVLTPRPETEFIIEAAKELFGPRRQINILDLGTGSGAIIITLLAEFPQSTGVGLDRSNNALAIARQNAYNHDITRVEFYCSDWNEENWTKKIKPQKFDLVVSNPPYIELTSKNTLEPELGFEPDIALYAGQNGLDAYKAIAAGLKGFEFDYAMFEIGQGQEKQVEQIFNTAGLKLTKTKHDLANIPRILVFNNEQRT